MNERQTAAKHTRLLFEWAARACATPLPPAIRRRAATILADDIGAMVAGSLEPQVTQARQDFVKSSSPLQEATVLAPGAAHVDRYAAACANGMAITWCELDEGFRNASCHGGAYTLPALLAEAEACNASVEQVLRALAVAYEVTTRFALAYPFGSFYVHPHAAFATLGAAVAVSLVRGHDARLLQDCPLTPRWRAPWYAMLGPLLAHGSACALLTGRKRALQGVSIRPTMCSLPICVPAACLSSSVPDWVSAGRSAMVITRCLPVATTLTPQWRPH
jgi:hypothetical protein